MAECKMQGVNSKNTAFANGSISGEMIFSAKSGHNLMVISRKMILFPS